MTCACPNATRTKRAHPGGGRAGCRGKLQVVMQVAVVLPLTSGRWMGEPWRGIGHRAKRHGHRLSARELLEASHRADVMCSSCGWSLRELKRGLRRRRVRRSC